jgi:hypothetical protein
MPRFVILRHDSPSGAHFDFMLESEGVLKTWALPQPPAIGVEMDCESLADHRLAYLEYEGPISGGRGSVTRCDQGTYATFQKDDAQWGVEVAGQRLVGKIILRKAEESPNRWRWLASPFA